LQTVSVRQHLGLNSAQCLIQLMLPMALGRPSRLVCDGVHQSSAASVHPAVYLFLAAQLLIGLGDADSLCLLSLHWWEFDTNHISVLHRYVRVSAVFSPGI